MLLLFEIDQFHQRSAVYQEACYVTLRKVNKNVLIMHRTVKDLRIISIFQFLA